jgi:hypothetical protein
MTRTLDHPSGKRPRGGSKQLPVRVWHGLGAVGQSPLQRGIVGLPQKRVTLPDTYDSPLTCGGC